MATHECSACLKETVKGADVVNPPLVLADSVCTAPGGRHTWTRIAQAQPLQAAVTALDKELIDRIKSSVLCLSMFVSTEDGDREDVVATAIVWDYTDNEVYILTNYHTWDDEEFRYCFPPPNETKPQKGKRKVTDAGTKSKKKGKNNSEMDDTNDDEEKVDPIKLKLYNEYDFSYTFVLSSDMFHRWEKDEDFAVLKLPKSQFTLPRIPICLEISITMKIHAFGYIGHTKVFNVTGGEVASLIPEGFTMNLLSAEGFSGAAILADGLGRAVGYMGGNLDASKKSNSQHQSYAFTFDRVAMVTERNITPKNSPAAKRTMGVK